MVQWIWQELFLPTPHGTFSFGRSSQTHTPNFGSDGAQEADGTRPAQPTRASSITEHTVNELSRLQLPAQPAFSSAGESSSRFGSNANTPRAERQAIFSPEQIQHFGGSDGTARAGTTSSEGTNRYATTGVTAERRPALEHAMDGAGLSDVSMADACPMGYEVGNHFPNITEAGSSVAVQPSPRAGSAQVATMGRVISNAEFIIDSLLGEGAASNVIHAGEGRARDVANAIIRVRQLVPDFEATLANNRSGRIRMWYLIHGNSTQPINVAMGGMEVAGPATFDQSMNAPVGATKRCLLMMLPMEPLVAQPRI